MAETITFTTPPTGPEAPESAAAAAPERPAWLPANFSTVEDYAKSLGDTQAALTRANQELAAIKTGGTKPAETPDVKPAEPTDKTAEGNQLEVKTDDGDEAGAVVDFTEYTNEFNSTGDVSEDSRVKIADSLKGMFGEQSRAIVDDYIDGAKNRVTNTTTQLKALAGGDDGYSEMISWARASLPKPEIAAFNRAVNSGDFHAASFAITSLKAKHTAVSGSNPSLIGGDNVAAASGSGFKSLYEMTEAIRDPRYNRDPDYRKSVEARAALSTF